MTPGQIGPGSNGDEEVLRFPQSSRAGPLQSDCLVSYAGNSLGSLTPAQRGSWCILQPQPTGPTVTGSYNCFIEDYYYLLETI